MPDPLPSKGVLEQRSVADAAAHRWTDLARMSQLVARARGLVETMRAILDGTVPYLADWAIVEVRDSSGGRRALDVAHACAEWTPGLLRLAALPSALHRHADGGELLFGEVDAARLRDLVDPQAFATLAEFAPRSIVALPLPGARAVHGTLLLVAAESGQVYQDQDLQLFRSVARHAGLALDSALAFEDGERSCREREQVLSIVSHDLRDPLNTIGLAVNSLDDPAMPQGTRTRQVDMIRRAVARMESLVANLLDVARIESGRLSVEPQPCTPEDLLREARLDVETSAEGAGLTIEVVASPDLPQVLADAPRLRQAFANLTGNAVSFTDAGGRIVLRALPAEGSVRFEVEDSGTGIASANLPHVFDWYWQAPRAGRAGAGLGLAITKGIVEAHGGALGVRSQPGLGTCFHFTIPAKTSAD